MNFRIEAPIKNLHPAVPPKTLFGEILEEVAAYLMLGMLFFGCSFGMPWIATWLCANF